MDKLHVSAFGGSATHVAAGREGIYEDEQLDVELDVTQSSKDQMGKLIDGTWDIVHTNADNVVWWSEDNGADLVIVMATPGRAGQDLVVPNAITSYEDLRGKVLAVDAAESGFVTPLREMLRQGGLPEEGKDYSFIEVGGGEQRMDAMRDGCASGAMIGASRDLTGENMHVIDGINRLYTNYASACATTRKWATENEELLMRYLRAHLRANAALGSGAGTPTFSWEGLTEMIEMRKTVGWLRGPVDAHQFADETLFKRVVADWKV
jgi:ABC-type nitrate/sulfonate/bicarbonate transport system substrate-binding protein